MTDTINGGTIIARANMPDPGIGFRKGEVILVHKPVQATNMEFVVATRYEKDTSWAHGTYLVDHANAVFEFTEKVKRTWGL
jgi:hypothetical protein